MNLILLNLLTVLTFPLAHALPIPPYVEKAFKENKSIELYSINPVKDENAKAEETLKDYTVLGKLALSVEDKKKVIEATNKSIKDSNGEVSRCFNPRHALNIVTEKASLLLIMCFECKQVYAYEKAERTAVIPIEDSETSKLFNEILTKAKIRLPD